MNYEWQNLKRQRRPELAIDADINKVVGKIKFESGSESKAVAFTPESKKAYAICRVKVDATVINAQEHKIIKKYLLNSVVDHSVLFSGRTARKPMFYLVWSQVEW